ncbi:MAG: hypothetical protein H0W56_00120 [Acidothermales bacterium]|nr:hypothetical protein [Acidothermales bacterium]
MLCTGVGLALGFGPIAIIFARMIAGKSRRLWLLLGARRFEFEPSSATRVVAGLVVVVFGIGFAGGILRDAEAAAGPLGNFVGYRVPASQLPPDAVAKLRALDDVRGVAVSTISRINPGPPDAVAAQPSGTPSAAPDSNALASNSGAAGKGPIAILFGECDDLRVIYDFPLTGCRPGNGYRIRSSEPGLNDLSVVPGRTVRLRTNPHEEGRRLQNHRHTEKESLAFMVPEQVLHVTADAAPLIFTDVLLPPEVLAKQGMPREADILVVSEPGTGTIERVSSGILRIAPNADIQVLDGDAQARRRAEVLSGLLHAALGLGVVVGVAAFLVAAIDRAVERRGNVAALRVVGVPRRTLRAAQAAGVVLPLAVGTALAIVAGKLVEQVTVAVGGYVRDWTWGQPVTALLVGLAAAVLAAAVTAAAVGKRLEASLLRRE